MRRHGGIGANTSHSASQTFGEHTWKTTYLPALWLFVSYIHFFIIINDMVFLRDRRISTKGPWGDLYPFPMHHQKALYTAYWGRGVLAFQNSLLRHYLVTRKSMGTSIRIIVIPSMLHCWQGDTDLGTDELPQNPVVSLRRFRSISRRPTKRPNAEQVI